MPFSPCARLIAHNGGGGLRCLPAHNARESGAPLIACAHVTRGSGETVARHSFGCCNVFQRFGWNSVQMPVVNGLIRGARGKRHDCGGIQYPRRHFTGLWRVGHGVLPKRLLAGCLRGVLKSARRWRDALRDGGCQKKSEFFFI